MVAALVVAAAAASTGWARSFGHERCRVRTVGLLLLIALPAFADVSAPSGGGANARRHVLTAEEARQCVPSLQPAEYFTPSAKEVEWVERALPAWLATVGGKPGVTAKRVGERLGTDHVWYFGQLEGGRRRIELRGFCAPLVEGSGRNGCFPLVKDGGDCIWYLRYDLAHGSFDHLYSNGRG